jgi:hypothetical protein
MNKRPFQFSLRSLRMVTSVPAVLISMVASISFIAVGKFARTGLPDRI